MGLRLLLVREEIAPMILVRLGGGLGNQMFQYATGRNLALKRGERLLLDATAYDGAEIKDITSRLYGLAHFNIDADIAPRELVEEQRKKRSTLFKKIARRFESIVLRRNHIRFEPHILKLEGNVYLEGFWQSEKYFKPIRPQLVKELSLAKPLSSASQHVAQRIEKTERSVSLHVRRGDYVANEEARRIYGSYCDAAYYKRAVARLEELMGGNINIFVFSDDIEWVKKNLDVGPSALYVSEAAAPDYERMMLMSLCKGHIICNSTFGWWPAWLDDKAEKVVIAPKVWIPGIHLPIDDILPPEWIRM